MILKEKIFDKNKIEYSFVMSSEHEYQLTKIVNSVLEVNSFVVKDTSTDISVNFEGYYLTFNKDDFANLSDVYVFFDSCVVDDGEIDDIERVHVIAVDDVSLCAQDYLHILTRVNNKLIAPKEVKLKVKSHNKITLDDGEL